MVFLSAQPTSWDWSISHDLSANENIRDVAVDPVSGDIYAIGSYQHFSLLGLVPGPFGLPNSAGETDAFLVKLDHTGTVQWTRRLGGAGADSGLGVALGPNGKVYVTGAFRGTLVDLLINGLLTTITSINNSMDVFLACYNANGALEWLERAGGADIEFGHSVAVNSTGVFLLGQFRSTAQFRTLTVDPPVNGKDHIFLAKYPLTGGNPHWVLQAGNLEDNVAGKITADEDGAYVTGSFKAGHLTWSTPLNSPISTVTCTNGLENIFITSVSNSGSINWNLAVDIPGGQARGNTIATGCGRVFLSGRIGTNAIFPGGTVVNQPGSSELLFVAALNAADGSTHWVRTASGSNGTNEGLDLHLGSNKQLYLSGTFNGSLTWDNGQDLTGNSGQEIFIARMAVTGETIWWRNETAPGGEWPYAITTDDQGRIIVAGAHTGNISLPPTSHTGSNNENIFIGSLIDPAWDQWTNDPSRWHHPGALCNANGTIDMNAHLRGHARSVVSSDGVSQQASILGDPNGTVSTFNGTPANMVLDVGDTLLTGTGFEFHWRSVTGGIARSIIETSMDGVAWTAHSVVPQTTAVSMVTVTMVAEQPLRFLRLRRPAQEPNAPFSIDGFTFRTGTSLTGTWSGDQVTSTGLYDPSGLAGDHALTYSAAIGGCPWSTTRLFTNMPPVNGTVVGSLTVCPGSSGHQLFLTDIDPSTSVLAWEQSADGILWTNVAENTDTLYTGPVLETTAFRAKLSNAACGDEVTAPHWLETEIPITLVCPDDVTIPAENAGCSATVVFEVLQYDSCGLSQLHYSHASGDAFPVGITSVNVAAIHDSIEIATCEFNVTVLDLQPPTIICPEDITIDAVIGQCGRTVEFETLASDNCMLGSLEYSPASGSFFPLGTTQVNAITTDATGLEATCTFTITVLDNDQDGDGVLDCDDGCPNDPLKSSPGVCGCGVADTDSNGDGIADCLGPCVTTLYLNGEGNGTDIPIAQLKTTTPTHPNLRNFDPQIDNVPGRMIKKGGSGINETALDKYQSWQMVPATPHLNSDVALRIWTAMKDFNTEKSGHMRIFLADCNATGGNCTTLATVLISRNTWDLQNTGTWIEEQITFGPIDHTFATGRRLAVKVIVLNSSDDDMWLAYDAIAYPSALSHGSFIDSDGDGTPDCIDLCPLDPNKQDPGICGCDAPEPGTLCDDGDPNTINDQVQPDCTCVGQHVDCAGVVNGTAFLDECGTCISGNNDVNPCTPDCNGEWGGTAYIDNCGDCVGETLGIEPCIADCNGDFGGSATIDNCGTCTGGNTGITPCIQDCHGDFGGSATIDNCGSCIGGNTGLIACIADCNGDFGGSATIDNCGTCVGGNTGLTACIADCNGDFGGSATIDNCGTCIGGNTGLAPCIADCNGDFGGSASLDNCGTCTGGSTGITPCIADCNGVFGGSATIDNCGTCTGGNTGLTACIADCNGVFGGSATIDNCGTCIGGNTGLTPCIQDCNGDYGGTASIDNCGTCVGGNTGLSPCIQDCLGIFGGTALPGTPCDDGDPCTINDTYGLDCECAGISSTPDATFYYASESFCANSSDPAPYIAVLGGTFTAVTEGVIIDPLTGVIDLGNSTPGTHTVTYSFDGTCPNIHLNTIVINGVPPSEWSSLAALCSNEQPIALNELLSPGTVIGGTWSGAGVIDDEFHPAGLNGQIQISYTVNAGDCSSTTWGFITVQPAPIANAGPHEYICGSSLTMQASAGGTGIWIVAPDVLVSDPGSPFAQITVPVFGTYEFIWSVTENGCTAQAQVEITFADPGHDLWVEAGPDQRLAVVKSTTLQGYARPGVEVLWSVIEGSGRLSHPDEHSTTVYDLGSGINRFTLTATLGQCAVRSDTVTVIVDELFIPQGFSPNHDGTNDFFEITGIEAYPNSSLQIFNRWGQEVYFNNDYRNTWAGRCPNGLELSNDTYYYILNLGGGETYNGFVIIKR